MSLEVTFHPPQPVQWVYLAYEGQRSRAAQAGSPLLHQSFIPSALLLIMDRLLQLLRYGAHPVMVCHHSHCGKSVMVSFDNIGTAHVLQILDGETPQEKERTGNQCRSSDGPYHMHSIVERLCKAVVRTHLHLVCMDLVE